MDLLQRDSAWRERTTAAMSLLCRMLAAVVPEWRSHPRSAGERRWSGCTA